jgi:hypothetical protein
MSTRIWRVLPMMVLIAQSHWAQAAAADDDDPKSASPSKIPDMTALTPQQRQALGIVVGHPPAAQLADRIDSFGLVLDTTTLVADVGDLSAVNAAERSTRAEVTRLQGLYGDGAGASLKMLEAARTEQARAIALTRATQARFNQHWGPLARMTPIERQKLLTAVAHGKILLLRADLPGRHSLGSLPDTAQLDVDGIHVLGTVLGIMQQADESQSVGLLVATTNAPAGLSPGARVPIALMMAKRSGVLLPREAVLYDERGAYVFEQATDKSAPGMTRYARHDVKLLQRQGEGWLVSGVDNDDDIVFQGAGVLWSLQGTGTRASVDDDND